MNFALTYGLMGAARGATQGLYSAWQDRQQEIQNQRLLLAKQMEDDRALQIAHQYRADENYQKFLYATQTNTQQDAAKSALQSQQQAAQATLNAADNASRQKVAVGNNATALRVANIRANAITNAANARGTSGGPLAQPTQALLDALGQDKSQTDPADPDNPTAAELYDTGPASTVRALARYRAAVNSGARTVAQIMNWSAQNPPLSGAPPQSNGDGSAGPVTPTYMVNGRPFPQPGNAPSSQPGGPVIPQAGANVTAPGSSSLNPVGVDSLTSAPPVGTWVKLQDGSVQQYSGPGQ